MNRQINHDVHELFMAEEEGEIGLLSLVALDEIDNSIHCREPCRDSNLPGASWMSELMFGHSNRIYEEVRMERHVFVNLCNLMKQRGWLQDSRYIRVDEQIAMFIQALQGSGSNRKISERFQHSGETISRFFHIVLKAFLKLGRERIRPPSFNEVPTQIRCSTKHWPFFKDCIGAIDGVHIDASVPVGLQVPYRNRKQGLSQNVMCVCDFNMKFTYVYAGWEGSANDCRVFNSARQDTNLIFPHPPAGKYYVVDSGYPTLRGYMTPFKGDRYHLRDYRGTGRQPRTAKELFNHRHSSLRNIIERAFGVLKARFGILKKMPSYPLNIQSAIVVVCCALHNYIKDEQMADASFAAFGDFDAIVPNQDNDHVILPGDVLVDENDNLHGTGPEMNALRVHIANQLARRHHLPQI